MSTSIALRNSGLWRLRSCWRSIGLINRLLKSQDCRLDRFQPEQATQARQQIVVTEQVVDDGGEDW